jgi:hypothetical protein
MEQILDWLNENELRAYPLLDSSQKTLQSEGYTWDLPDNFLLDLQLKVISHSLADHIGVLSKIELLAGSLRTTFSLLNIETEELSSLTVFDVPAALTQTYPFYVRNSDGCLAVFGEGVKKFIEENQNHSVLTAEIPTEPSVLTQFNDAWLGVSAIISSPEKITEQSGYAPARPLADVYDYSAPITEENKPTKLVGDVKFLEGYHFRVNIASEAIDLEIGANFGLRTNCTTSFIPSQYLDCEELVSYINGVPPDNQGSFRLLAGTNIALTPGATINTGFTDSLTETVNNNTLFVGLTFQTTDLCAPVNINPSAL